MEEAQRFEQAVEDGSTPDDQASFKMNNQEAFKISKEMEDDKAKLDSFASKIPSLDDVNSGKLDKDTQNITNEMSKGAEDKDLAVADLQAMTAKADAEILKEEKEKGGKDEDLKNITDDLEQGAKMDDVGVENMNLRFKEKQRKTAENMNKQLKDEQLTSDSPADDLLKKREKIWDEDEEITPTLPNQKNITYNAKPQVKAIAKNNNTIKAKKWSCILFVYFN